MLTPSSYGGKMPAAKFPVAARRTDGQPRATVDPDAAAGATGTARPAVTAADLKVIIYGRSDPGQDSLAKSRTPDC